MANVLDEETGYVKAEGRDVNVISTQIPVKVGVGSLIFEILLWVLGIIPGVIFLFLKIKAGTRLRQIEQKLQHDASQIDNYLEQRVVILRNLAHLIEKSITLDKETYKEISLARSEKSLTDDERISRGTDIERASSKLRVTVEAYPELEAHKDIKEAIQQNSYLQKEITAAREVYNDTVNQWNRIIQEWPTYMIVAARNGYTTRIPYSVSADIKKEARETFF